mmetsp:Transcript_29271/g.62204  ORF Transcript_29271/g.62204 Transcript_29271/m.62204 type:complete len:266 (+) Transcript_29271:760-1557(+)
MSAMRPNVSTTFSATSLFSNKVGLLTISKSDSTAWSNAGTSPGSACGTIPWTVLQMAATIFRRQRTTGSAPSLRTNISSKACSSSGKRCTSVSSDTWQASSAIATRPPFTSCATCGDLFMTSSTAPKPESCPKANIASSSAPCPPSSTLVRQLRRIKASGAPNWRKACFGSEPPLAREAMVPAQARTRSSPVVPRSAAPRNACTTSGTPPRSTRSQPNCGSSCTNAFKHEQQASCTSKFWERCPKSSTRSSTKAPASGAGSCPLS